MEPTKDINTIGMVKVDPANANLLGPKLSNDNSFMTIVYDEISAAIGGNNGNQFLCLQIPGTILKAEDYKYDLQGISSKPLTVEANESRLANKMFDPCRITGSDNGFSLPYQYESALDLLSPKLNRNASIIKNRLRQLLLSEYPYDLGDGVETKYTLQQVYFKLYDDYVTTLNEWSKIQSQKKEELKQQYPLIPDYKEAYLEWYEMESEKILTAIEEKKAKVLSIFSPNDMKILEGVLDSGCGAELQESRQTLRHFRKFTPSGGYVYPVRFTPPNWFEMIGSSFTKTDLVNSPDKISADLQDLSLRRMQLCSYIESFADLLIESKESEDSSFSKAIFATNKYRCTLNKAEEEAINHLFRTNINIKYTTIKNIPPSPTDDEFRKILVPLTEIRSNIGKFITKSIISILTERANISISSDEFTKKIVLDEDGKISLITRKRNEYINAINILIQEIRERIKQDNFSSFTSTLMPVIEQLDAINKKIPIILEDLKYSMSLPTNISDDFFSKSTTPKGFTQIEINADMQSLEEDTFYTKSNNVTTKGLGLILMGRKRLTPSLKKTSSKNLWDKASIKITMNVAKIGIERDWFNPGIFALTKNMIKMGNALISPPSDKYEGITEQRLQDMKNCIFPCYPVALVIARDISINFIFDGKTSSLSEQYRIIEQQALSGSGFLMFRNKTWDSKNQTSSPHVSMNKKTITVKIDTTQLIGYYLEATKADQSIPFESLTPKRREIENVSTIYDFASEYKSMINTATDIIKEVEKNETNHKQIGEHIMQTKKTLILEGIKSGQYMSWFATTQAANTISVKLYDSKTVYIDNSKTSLDMATPLAQGGAFVLGEGLTLEISSSGNNELRLSHSMTDITTDTGKCIGKSFALAGEDYTDDDFNDICISISSWNRTY